MSVIHGGFTDGLDGLNTILHISPTLPLKVNGGGPNGGKGLTRRRHTCHRQT